MKRRVWVWVMCMVFAVCALAGCASDKASKLALKAAEAYDDGDLDGAYDYYQQMLAIDPEFSNDNTVYLQEKFEAHDVALCSKVLEGVNTSLADAEIAEQLTEAAQKGDLVVTVTAKGIRSGNTVLYNAAKSKLGTGNNKFYAQFYQSDTYIVMVSLGDDGKLSVTGGFKEKTV